MATDVAIRRDTESPPRRSESRFRKAGVGSCFSNLKFGSGGPIQPYPRFQKTCSFLGFPYLLVKWIEESRENNVAF